MALLKDDLETLRRVPMFAAIDMRRLKLIAFTSARLSYEIGDVLFQQGEDGSAAFVILKGQVDIIVERADTEVQIGTLGCNEMVGDISLLCNECHIASARARTHVDALKIMRTQFNELIRSSPEASISILHHLAQKVARTAQSIADLKVEAAHRADDGTG